MSNPERIERRLARRLALARLAILWERLWPGFGPALAVIAGFIALSLVEVWAYLPGWLHGLGLAAFAGALLVALWYGLGGLKLPSRAAARRRLEVNGGIAHRPLTVLQDELATGHGDWAAQAIWKLHRRRMRAALDRLQVGVPQAGLARHDPRGFRAALALGLFVGLMVAGWDAPRRLAAALEPDFVGRAATPPLLDAWINPPAYTGLPPMFLTRADGPGAVTPPDSELQVPVGSTLLARLHGAADPATVRLGAADHPFEVIDKQNQQIEVEVPLDAGDRLAFLQAGEQLAGWPLTVVPDLPPAVVLPEPPQATVRNSLRLVYDAYDDYGLAGVIAAFRRDGDPKSLELELPLPGLRPREAHEASYRDLTAHPWAGLSVTLTLVARDDLGQTGESEPVALVLPERIFTHPVARALIEQRKKLALDPDKRDQVERALDAISKAPEAFDHDTTTYLALRSARFRLQGEKDDQAIEDVQEILWETALRLEDGLLSLAERRLRDAQQALMDALSRDATDEEITRLMDELQAAMEEFLQALMDQARQRGETPQEIDPNQMSVDTQSLQDLLDKARELSRSGARDSARDLLAQLQNMLENLKAGRMAQGSEQQQGEQFLNDLSELMQRQQELLDRTFRENQRGQSSRPGQTPQGSQPGRRGQRGNLPQQGAPGEDFFGPDGLTTQQEALRRQLGDLMRRLGEGFGEIPRPLGRAERSMRDARESLQMGEPGGAVGPQSDAMDQMRQGAEAMMQEMMQRFGQARRDGEAPFGRAGGNNQDPLGRPLGAQWDYGDSVELPDESDLQRAREILEELYRRSGQRERPTDELDYIDRLLKRF